MTKIILTDNLITLRPFELEDAKSHLAGEDDETRKYLSGGKSTIESFTKWVNANKIQWQNDGPIYNFAILNEQNQLIGMIEASKDRDEIDGLEKGDANISYGLHPQFRGKGYMGRSLKLIEDFLKQKGLKRSVIRVEPENINSLKVPERYGYTKIDLVNTKDNHTLVRFRKVL